MRRVSAGMFRGTAPRTRTFHQGRANPHGPVTSRMSRRPTVCPHTRSNPITRYRLSSRSPAARRVYASLFRAPRKRTFPQGRANPNGTATSPTSRRHTVCPDTSRRHVIRHHKSSRSPATRRVYASLFRAVEWHSATQTHLPPRPRKSAWHCDIARVIRHTVCPHTGSNPNDTANHPAQQRHPAFTPACFALPGGTAPRKRNFHQGRANPHGTATSRTSRRPTVCPHTRSKHVTRYHKSSRSPATRRVYASLFRASEWHGATQTYFPARPRKSAWHCDITDVIRHTVCPHTRSNPITRYRQSSRSPVTPRVSASVFRAPQWYGSTQTHFPSRPFKSAWHCDSTDVIRHTVCPHTRSYSSTR